MATQDPDQLQQPQASSRVESILSTPDTTPSHRLTCLFDLPLEIRIKIYYLVFHSTRVVYDVFGESPTLRRYAEDNNNIEDAHTNNYQRTSDLPISHRYHNGLLLTSKRCYIESAPIYFNTIDVVFHMDWSPLTHSLPIRCPLLCKSVHKLTVVRPSNWYQLSWPMLTNLKQCTIIRDDIMGGCYEIPLLRRNDLDIQRNLVLERLSADQLRKICWEHLHSPGLERTKSRFVKAGVALWIRSMGAVVLREPDDARDQATRTCVQVTWRREFAYNVITNELRLKDPCQLPTGTDPKHFIWNPGRWLYVPKPNLLNTVDLNWMDDPGWTSVGEMKIAISGYINTLPI